MDMAHDSATAAHRRSSPAISFDGFKDDDIIDKKQLAGCLRCSVRTVETKSHQVRGIPHIAGNGKTLYIVGSVKKWLISREVTPGAKSRKRRAA